MSKPLVRMAIEVLEARAVKDFIKGIDITALDTDELHDLIKTLEYKRIEIKKELYFNRGVEAMEGVKKNGNETEHPLNPKF